MYLLPKIIKFSNKWDPPLHQHRCRHHNRHHLIPPLVSSSAAISISITINHPHHHLQQHHDHHQNHKSPQAVFIRRLLNIFLCMSQIGSNAVYILFVAQNILPVNFEIFFCNPPLKYSFIEQNIMTVNWLFKETIF